MEISLSKLEYYSQNITTAWHFLCQMISFLTIYFKIGVSMQLLSLFLKLLRFTFYFALFWINISSMFLHTLSPHRYDLGDEHIYAFH